MPSAIVQRPRLDKLNGQAEFLCRCFAFFYVSGCDLNVRIDQQGDSGQSREGLSEELQAFRTELNREIHEPRDISARPRQLSTRLLPSRVRNSPPPDTAP